MMEVDEDPVTRKRRLAKERQVRWRAKQTSESVEALRAKDNESHKKRLRSLSPAQLQAHRVANAASQRQRVSLMSPAQLQAHRAANAASQHQRVSLMSPAQLQAHRVANAASQQQHRERLNEALRREAINFNASNTVQHDCGQFGGQSLNCQYCGAKHFEGERPSNGLFMPCCRKEKVMLPKPQEIYPFLVVGHTDSNACNNIHMESQLNDCQNEADSTHSKEESSENDTADHVQSSKPHDESVDSGPVLENGEMPEPDVNKTTTDNIEPQTKSSSKQDKAGFVEVAVNSSISDQNKLGTADSHANISDSKIKQAAKETNQGVSDNKSMDVVKGKDKSAKSGNTKPPESKGTTSSLLDTTADDIEFIGESKPSQKMVPKKSGSHNAGLVAAGAPNSMLSNLSFSNNHSLSAGYNISIGQSTSTMHGSSPGYTTANGIPGLPSNFLSPSGPGQVAQNAFVVSSMAPPKPKSSLDQIELIRWEIQNRINTRPKYFKPSAASELGPLAKFLFDIGLDLIKESVYHDLVKIQSKKNGDDKLNAKEKEDLEKLKDIEKELFTTIGHLKLRLRQKCKVCNFQTESSNVMALHKQYPHEENKFLSCAHCSFVTKQSQVFKFHIEAEHNVQPKLHDKKAFYECDLCPYENNQEQKLILHKQRCIKQFRPGFNLHPSCLSGAEINLCLENIFYRPIIPKNIKLLQFKHAQQQAALAEARRQQAQMQALAAQKNAAAVALRKQHPQLMQSNRMPIPIAPGPSALANSRMPVPPRTPAPSQPVRYASPAAIKSPAGINMRAPVGMKTPLAMKSPKAPSPTVASMLNAKQKQTPGPSPAPVPNNAAPSGFEVCEICGGFVKDRKALRIHFFYAHRIDLPFNLFDRNQAPLYCATCYVRFWTAHGLRKHIDVHKEENQTRGVVGKCISCGHHVLNLLLHMRVVHKLELHHYLNAQMCMFCGSAFTSPQECEKHILKVHGLVDPSTGTLKCPPTAPHQASLPATPSPQPPQKQAAKKPGNNNLVKGSVCVLCNLNFGRNVDLTRHCMRVHHTCMKCGMVVIDKASLMKHTCLSSPSGTRDCNMCEETGFHPAYFVKHLRDKHLRRFSIKVSQLAKSTIDKWTKRACPFEDNQLVEISDDEGGTEPRQDKEARSVARTGKRPRIGPACKIGRDRLECQTTEETIKINVNTNDNLEAKVELVINPLSEPAEAECDIPCESSKEAGQNEGSDEPGENEGSDKPGQDEGSDEPGQNEVSDEPCKNEVSGETGQNQVSDKPGQDEGSGELCQNEISTEACKIEGSDESCQVERSQKACQNEGSDDPCQDESSKETHQRQKRKCEEPADDENSPKKQK